jgi:hypothetical protein
LILFAFVLAYYVSHIVRAGALVSPRACLSQP